MGLFRTEKQDPRLDEWLGRVEEAQEEAYTAAKSLESVLGRLVEARARMRLAEAQLPALVLEGDALVREAGIDPAGEDRSLSVNTCLGGAMKFTASIPDMLLASIDSMIMTRAQAQSLERRLRADEQDRATAPRVGSQRMSFPATTAYPSVVMDHVRLTAPADAPHIESVRGPLGWQDNPADLFPASDLVRSDRLAALEQEERVLNRGGAS
jgi:hypothetical protein